MSSEVTKHFVKEFNAGVRLLQQQIPSRLRMAVMVDPGVVGDRAFFDQMDATAMHEVTNRHGDTEITDTPHRRRMVTLRTYEVADLVDRADQRRLLNDPVSPYTRSMAAAANRKIDDVILSSMDGSASTGVDGSLPVSFPAGNSYNATGTSQALKVEDLLKARKLLEAAENEEDDGDNKWFMCLSAGARAQLMTQEQVSSQDYNTVRALSEGTIKSYMGMELIKSQRSGLAGAIRDCFVWVKKSVQLAIGQDPRSFMDVIPSKRHSIQVRHELDCGATRMDEKGVVRILVDESVAGDE